MPDLADRSQRERAVFERLGPVFVRQARQMERDADERNAVDWEKFVLATAAALTPVIRDTYRTAGNTLGLQLGLPDSFGSGLRRASDDWARARALEVADGVVSTTRDRLNAAAPAVQAAVETRRRQREREGLPLSAVEIDQLARNLWRGHLQTTFGPSRAESIAITEVTTAATAGEEETTNFTKHALALAGLGLLFGGAAYVATRRKPEDKRVDQVVDVAKQTAQAAESARKRAMAELSKRKEAREILDRYGTKPMGEAADELNRRGVGDRVAVKHWVTEGDAAVCPICRPLHLQPVDKWREILRGVRVNNKPLASAQIARIIRQGGPAAHPNCILPGTEVLALGTLEAAAESFYEGPCIEISLENGRRLTVTQNHPVLTPSGWQPAHRLAVGGYVVCATDAQRIAASINPDDNDVPALIEDVFASLDVSAEMATASVPAAPEQFHGDGQRLDGDVRVVATNRLLRDGLNRTILEHFEEEDFGDGLGMEQPLTGSGNLALKLPRSLDASAGLVGCRDLPGTLRGRHSTPLGSLGIGLAPGLDSGIKQSFSESGAIDPTLARQFVLRFAGLISAEQIVKVRKFDVATHVYDLQVGPYELYSGNSAIVKNCRCWTETRLLPAPSPGGSPTQPGRRPKPPEAVTIPGGAEDRAMADLVAAIRELRGEIDIKSREIAAAK